LQVKNEIKADFFSYLGKHITAMLALPEVVIRSMVKPVEDVVF
jgi:hypothetical protein